MPCGAEATRAGMHTAMGLRKCMYAACNSRARTEPCRAARLHLAHLRPPYILLRIAVCLSQAQDVLAGSRQAAARRQPGRKAWPAPQRVHRSTHVQKAVAGWHVNCLQAGQ